MTGGNRYFTEDFKKGTVRLSYESGRTVEQVAKDFGIGKSTLSTWQCQFHDADLAAGPHEDLEKENARLRGENENLHKERDLLKK